MEIRVLGCYGSQLPGFNTTSFLLDGKILLDGGTITSVLTAEEQLKIEVVLVTHAHLDHIRDIMFLVDNLCFLKKKQPLLVLSTSPVIKALRHHLFNNVIWPDFSRIPSAEAPVLIFKVLGLGRPLSLSGVSVTAFKVNHAVETVGYVIESPEGTVIFSGDTGPTDEIWRIARKKRGRLKAIFMETSLPEDMQQIALKTGHLTPRSLEEELEKLGDPDVPVYLYHLKSQWREIIKKEVAELRNGNIHILEDGQILQIGAL